MSENNNSSFYSVRSNLGTPDSPFYVARDIGRCTSPAEAMESGSHLLKDCEAFLTWHLFEGEMMTEHFLETQPSSQDGIACEVSVHGNTEDEILEAIREISELPLFAKASDSKGGPGYALKVAGAPDHKVASEVMKAPWYVDENSHGLYVPLEDFYQCSDYLVEEALLEAHRDGISSPDNVIAHVLNKTGVQLVLVPDVLKRHSALTNLYYTA